MTLPSGPGPLPAPPVGISKPTAPSAMRPGTPFESEQLDVLLARYEKVATKKGFVGLDTGFKHLNNTLQGLGAGLYAFVGPPGCGKTSFVKQLADQVATDSGVPVLFFTFEQSADELRVKTLARLAKVNSREIPKGNTNYIFVPYPGAPIVQVWEEVKKAAPKFKMIGQKMRIVESGQSETVEWIGEQAREMLKQTSSDKMLIVIDPLHAIAKDEPAVTTPLASQLRRLARDLGCPIVTTVADRSCCFPDNRRPTLITNATEHHLQDSADAVIVFWTNPAATAQFRTQGTIDVPDYRRSVSLYVLKSRVSDPIEIKYVFSPDLSTFTEAERLVLNYTDAFITEEQT